ncbi:zinc finger CCCH domain-containing protein 33-like [Asparagus officinalis]|nr:zinc finger CCCH domain-containing protein 33-like [Asparagus officinalis]
MSAQNLTQQLISGYHSNLPSSPTLNSSSSSFGLDHSMAKAIMNSRSAAFAQRSQSFIDRGAVNRLSGGFSASPATAGMGLTNWGSPDGKLDWGIQGEELNKLRKSASFGFRNNQSLSPPRAPAPAEAFNEPDLSWVQSLVKDGEFMSSPWGEEQMVA